MTAGNPVKHGEVAMKRRQELFSIGAFLVYVGVLWITDGWWPYIMIGPALAIGAGLLFRGEVRNGLFMLAFSGAGAAVLWAIETAGIDWDLVGGLFTVATGVVVIVKTLTSRGEID